jgi:glycosyltransferase involved in cell wall biosynthesis
MPLLNSVDQLANLSCHSEKRVVLVLHFGDAHFRGSERCALNLIKGVDLNKYTVVLWTNHRELAVMASDAASHVLLSDFSPIFGFGYQTPAGGKLASFIALLRQARCAIKTAQPNIIICNGLAPCQWIAHLSILYRIPLLTYIHAAYLPKLRVLSFAYASSCLVGVSEFTLRYFREDGFPRKRSMVVYNGVDDLSLIKFSPQPSLREELGIGNDEFVVGSLSALVDSKRVDLIIEAFKLANFVPGKQMALLIIGDGPCLKDLQELAHGHRVFFCGWRKDVAHVLKAVDCVVVTAEREASGLNILEAASMKLPVIGTDSGGIPEGIIDGETGFLSKPGSAQSFAENILKLRDHAGLREKLGRNARSVFEKKFRVERMQTDMNALIELLSSRKEGIVGRLGRFCHLSLRAIVRRIA